MSKKHEPDNFEQMSIFGIMNLLDNTENTLSSDDISKIIDKLSDAKRKRESIEAKKRRQEEREKREREAREAKERKEAHIREVTSMDLPLDWENVFNQDVRTQGVHADSISDGLMYSLSNLGRVDIEYISSITGEDYKTIICALKGSIYQNPETWGECFYKGWETSEEYLSGNMIRKWKAAKEADKEYNGYFAENIKAIEKVIPPTVATNDIYITLGSPWVPADVIDDFIEYLLGDWRRHWYKALANRLMHIEVEGSFKSWKEWAVTSGINDKVIGFLSFRPNYLMGFDSGSEDLAFPTPRAWEMVSNILNGISDNIDDMYSLIAGIVGSGVAVEFRTWAKVYKDLPSIEEIFDGKMPSMPKNTDAMYALTASMSCYARTHKNELSRIANSIRYADKMPPDFSAVLLKDYMHIEKDFKQTLLTIPEISKWLQTKGGLMNGSVK